MATCADFITAMWQKEMLKPEINSMINSVDDIKPLAEELVTALDTAFKKADNENQNIQMYTNQKIGDTAILLVITRGWWK